MNKKGVNMVASMVIVFAILILFFVFVGMPLLQKTRGGAETGGEVLNKQKVELCLQSEEMLSLQGKESIDKDSDGVPDNCDVCVGTSASCKNSQDSDGDEIPAGCDKDDTDSQKNKCFDSQSGSECKCGKILG